MRLILLIVPFTLAYLPPYPSGWDASEPVSSFKTEASGARSVDAWNYTHRLGMYKTILNGSKDHCLWTSEKQLGNPVWGLPLQHGWQEYSGRLCINATRGESGMQPSCWWACANYYFSVFPYLGAQEAGIVPPIHLHATPGGDPAAQFCDTDPEGCRNHPAVLNWARFFRTVLATASSCTPSSLPDPASPLMSMLMSQYWAGHTATLNATKQCAGHIPHLSPPEQDFALGWSNLVSFLGPTQFNVNYSETSNLQQILPYRVLKAGDKPGSIPDMDKATNLGVLLVEALTVANDKTNGFFLQEWEKAMCSDEARVQARDAIDKGLTDVSILAKDTVKILWDLAFSKKNCTKP